MASLMKSALGGKKTAKQIDGSSEKSNGSNFTASNKNSGGKSSSIWWRGKSSTKQSHKDEDDDDQKSVKSSTISTVDGDFDAINGRSPLEEAFRRMTESKEVKAQMGRIFKKVRIMVVGRSGSGKTTVIRLVVGEKGPRTISVGEAGVQDISVEWPHPDPDLPLVFHDSNGIDVVGSSRISEIRQFLDQRQHSDNFSDKIHVVWYIFSAADTRFLDDGGLMEMLDHYPDLPVLLIMTFNDHDKFVKKNVDGGNLEKLLCRISDSHRRNRILAGMVRIGNDVQQEADGSISGIRDLEGLKQLTVRTKELISKELHATWAACQATNVDVKLSASAKLIVGAKRSEIFSTVVLAALPVARQAQLGLMLMTVTRSLCKVWGVPESMEKAIVSEFFMVEGGKGVLINVLYNVGAAIGLAGTLTAAVFTAGAAAAAVVAVVVASAFSQMKATASLVISYSLVVLGVILYIKARLPTSDQSFDPKKPVEYYGEKCREFATSDDVRQIKSFVQIYGSTWDKGSSSKAQIGRLKKDLVQFFNFLLLNRPNAFFSMLKQRMDADDGGGDANSAVNADSGVHADADADEIDPEKFLPKRKNQSQRPPLQIDNYFDDSESDDDDNDLYPFQNGFATTNR